MSDNHSHEALRGYAAQVLAGTGLSTADVTATTPTAADGSAAQALREGWQVAERAATISEDAR